MATEPQTETGMDSGPETDASADNSELIREGAAFEFGMHDIAPEGI